MDNQGDKLWRTLEELVDSPEFRRGLEAEFAEQAGEWPDTIDRRRFLQLMGSSLALAGLYGCWRRPEQQVFPYVNPPELVVPGKPLTYATAMPFGGYGIGLLATSHEGRPTKLEGNPDHPASLGATNAIGQSSILMLYDPDRANATTHVGSVSSWGNLLNTLRPWRDHWRSRQGAGLHILTETVTSPCLADQLRRLREAFPMARWHVFDPISRDSVRQGTRLAFGEPANVIWRFDRAKRIVVLDCDFLFTEPGSLRYARDFADQRRVSIGRHEMNRLYVAEPSPTLTGATADHRLAVRAEDIAEVARFLARCVGMEMTGASPRLDAAQIRWCQAAADDLKAHRGSGLVLAGIGQPPEVHALVHRLNVVLGNDANVEFTEPVEVLPADGNTGIVPLVEAMQTGQVEGLFILGGNPAYTTSADLNFADALVTLSKARSTDGSFKNLTVHLSQYYNETSFRCQWHVPQNHCLESWSDIRAFDGTVSLVQPLIAPLHQSKQDTEVIEALLGELDLDAYQILRRFWTEQIGNQDFERFWRTTLEKGIIEDSAYSPHRFETQSASVETGPATTADRIGGNETFEIVFKPDYCVWDGTYANIGWQQELPRPLTKITWDNAALISPEDAERLDLTTGEIVELAYRGGSVRAPIYVMPGQARGSITVHLGYGRTHAGATGTGVGFNAYALRTSDAPWFGQGLRITKTGRRHRFAVTSAHHTMVSRGFNGRAEQDVVTEAAGTSSHGHDNRRLIRTGTLEQFRKDPAAFKHEEKLLSLYPPFEYDHNRWAMSIDLNTCIGCGACVAACQAENNIPVVGREQVLMSREMQWIRIDHYFQGPPENPRVYHQPVPCMHCENAPCEVVCPVNATVHDSEGINNMVYNRCVGTRYCSNNCPYKVRRFNFLQYSDNVHPTIQMQKNPNVTVRSRGVMEKCTYCIQRIAKARIEAEKENRPIGDGEVVTACQQVCPAQVIVFGNLNDPGSRVSQLKQSPLDYGILTELTTKPRTTYLAKLWNPNPALVDHAHTGPAA